MAHGATAWKQSPAITRCQNNPKAIISSARPSRSMFAPVHSVVDAYRLHGAR